VAVPTVGLEQWYSTRSSYSTVAKGGLQMNERIEELKKQAEAAADEIFDRKGKMYGEIVMEKFAELIVKECAEVGLDSVEDGDDLDAIMKRVHNNILKHFGVAE
jgi:hypothetical protein